MSRLARLAEPLQPIMQFRELAIAAGEWPVMAADNDNRLEAAPEDLAGMRAETRLDARPALPYLEGLKRADGAWDLGRLRFAKTDATADKHAPLDGALVGYQAGSGRWLKPRDGFGAVKRADVPTADNDNDADAGLIALDVDAAAERAPRPRFDGFGSPSLFIWDRHATTAADRALWRAQLLALCCDGGTPLADACAANGLTPKVAPAGRKAVLLIYPAARIVADDAAEHLGPRRPAPPLPAQSNAEAGEVFRRVCDLIGPRHAEVALAAALARKLSHGAASRGHAGVVSERHLLQSSAALKEAFAVIANDY